MSYPFYILFGLMPSFVWLTLYLKKDNHPEPNRMILKIFFFGMIIALPAVLLEMGIMETTSLIADGLNGGSFLIMLINVFLGVALVEEFLKYLVVREKVLKHPALDEPVDLMIYMIISALGFAASENILILFSFGSPFLLGKIFSVSLFRFLGATFLHALASGMIGYFLARSLCETKKRLQFYFLGLGLATLLHGLYNFSIMEIEGSLGLLIPMLILIGLAIFITIAFQRLKKLKGVCNLS